MNNDYYLESRPQSNDLAKGTFLENWPNWIRWLLFLPSAILVPMLFYVFQSIMQSWFLDIGPNAFYLVLMRGVVYGFGFVFVGSYVAPSHQKVVSIILIVLISMLSGIGIFSAIVTASPIKDSIEGVIMLISAGYATHSISKEFND